MSELKSMFKFSSKKDLTCEFKCTIKLLDDEEVLECDFTKEHKGQHLLDYCYKSLNLLEKDYFGLRYVDNKQQRNWLDPTRCIVKQIKGLSPVVFCFRVKFYPADPIRLKEEVTRYFVFMQLRRDLLHGRLQCSSNELPLLMAYIIQSELGDYDPEEHGENYVSSFKLVPNQSTKLSQTTSLEKTVAEIHQKDMRGLTPGDAELNFIKKASSLETYGIDPHPVKDHKGKQLYLGINHIGVTTFQGSRKVQSFKWNEIQKLTYEGRMFIVHASTNDKKKHLVGFKCPNTSACHFLWRCAVEQRYFFTMNSSSDIPLVTTGGGLFKTCKLRYTGRVEKEIINDMKDIDRKEATIQRSYSTTSAPPHIRTIGRSSTAPITTSEHDREQESPDRGSNFITKDPYWNYSTFSEPEENHVTSSPHTLDPFDEEDWDTSMTSTLPTEFDLRPDITPTDEESRSMAFEIPAVRSSPSASLFNKDMEDDTLGEEEDGDLDENGDYGDDVNGKRKRTIVSPLIKLSSSSDEDKKTEENPFDPLGCRPYSNLLPIRTFMLTTLLLLLLFSCLVILIIESESDVFGPIRKVPEMVILRRDYYEPMKKNFFRKFIS
ncbi:FERM domain-containing protein 5 [Tetranychus urticae]|uniref:Moesin/ezrin/radixin homolog 1 n=1 Tax=Tetranychus urticae TaxID=32264 RepID=T1KWY1_TETUR|nr:FERM domain-containing protein 5 [Tetranychus urticae]XP_015791270.1 FERM domain-containing protein 5 [Tetranychus urticae]XP_015791272.1 FERM domain-containing protein 5 [Tetranychus urticae]XP_015791273.1 FERM domain-containing protein 5 [Tetranychus urticae]